MLQARITNRLISAATLLLLLGAFQVDLFSQVAVNTDGSSADGSAMLEVTATDKGMLVPRLTTTQRDNISTPAEGLLIYNTTDDQFEFYNGSAWGAVGGGGGGLSRTTQTISSNTTLTGTGDITVRITGAYNVYLPASPVDGQIVVLLTTNYSARIYGNGNNIQDGTWTGSNASFAEYGAGKYLVHLIYFNGIWHTSYTRAE